MVVMSILLYGCTTWMLTERMEKKLDINYTRMLQAILNKSWRQHPTKQQLYGHIPPIMKTIQVRHCWRSNDKLISNILLWTPSHGRVKAGQPARTYIQQPCADTRCSLEDLPGALDNRRVARKGQWNLCWWHNMLIITLTYYHLLFTWYQVFFLHVCLYLLLYYLSMSQVIKFPLALFTILCIDYILYM